MAERFGAVFRIGYHNPALVGIYLLLVGGFIYGVLRPRSSAEWRSLGVAQAFVVALYAEMYGLPLTMFGLAWLTGRTDFASDHFHGHAWAYLLGWGETGAVTLTILGNLLVAAGGLLALAGWRQIHRGGGQLVCTGLYRRIRHPQYTGFFLFLTGSIVNPRNGGWRRGSAAFGVGKAEFGGGIGCGRAGGGETQPLRAGMAARGRR